MIDFETIYRESLKESGGYYGKNYYESIQDIINDYKKGWISRFQSYDIAEKFGWDLDSHSKWNELMNEGLEDDNDDYDYICTICGKSFDPDISQSSFRCQSCDEKYHNDVGNDDRFNKTK